MIIDNTKLSPSTNQTKSTCESTRWLYKFSLFPISWGVQNRPDDQNLSDLITKPDLN